MVLCAACDGTATERDGAPEDADLVNFELTGTYLDWDSPAIVPCPIVDAKWYATYDDSRVAMTDANGRFSISLASYTPLLDIVPPDAPSTCASGRYELHGIAIAPPAVVRAGGTFIARSLTTARVASFYASFGAGFDANRGHLLIHVDGAPRTLTITGAHDPAQTFNGTTWGAGDLGSDVFFPNIELTGMTPMTTVTVAGGNALGLGSVPLAGGSITYMTVILN
jgi:hypothetical protein